MSSTFLSANDNMAERLILTNVFPSPDIVEVTRTTFSDGKSRANCNFVRNNLKSSEFVLALALKSMIAPSVLLWANSVNTGTSV